MITQGGDGPTCTCTSTCTWSLRTGTLTVVAIPPRYTLYLKGEAELALHTPLLHHCPPHQTLDQSLSVEPLAWEDLPPWLGGARKAR